MDEHLPKKYLFVNIIFCLFSSYTLFHCLKIEKINIKHNNFLPRDLSGGGNLSWRRSVSNEFVWRLLKKHELGDHYETIPLTPEQKAQIQRAQENNSFKNAVEQALYFYLVLPFICIWCLLAIFQSLLVKHENYLFSSFLNFVTLISSSCSLYYMFTREYFSAIFSG